MTMARPRMIVSELRERVLRRLHPVGRLQACVQRERLAKMFCGQRRIERRGKQSEMMTRRPEDMNTFSTMYRSWKGSAAL